MALVAFLLALQPGIAAASENKSPAAEGGHGEAGEGDRKAAIGVQFFRLDPFVVPVFDRSGVKRHLILMITLELSDERYRSDVRAKMPPMRQAIYSSLYQIFGTNPEAAKSPPLATVKRKVLSISQVLIGKEHVRSVLMESVYDRRLR